MTKIVICGANGKMGHTVASCIDGRDDCTVIGGVDSYTAKYADFPIVATPAELPEVPDVIIDFSNPSTLDELLEYAMLHWCWQPLAMTMHRSRKSRVHLNRFRYSLRSTCH